MAYSVFYSWQTDSPAKCNRTFIRDAIDAAAAELAQDVSVEDAPRIESGMEGVSGTPEVATVMFEKIKNSAVFIGDVTLVGMIQNSSKPTPNPNVLLEMGFAAGILGWGRVICVMNENYGAREEQPFDVRNRRFPINYTLNPDTMRDSVRVREDLTKWLKYAIEAVHANEYAAVQETIGSLDVTCLILMYTFGKQDSFPAPDPNHTTIGGPLDTAKFNGEVVRLLDLRVLKSDVSPAALLYAYHWTYLGKQVLIHLGIRPAPTKPAAPAMKS